MTGDLPTAAAGGAAGGEPGGVPPPALRLWHAAEVATPRGGVEGSMLLVLGIGPDPRRPGRHRWDVLRWHRDLLGDAVWRVEGLEPAEDGVMVDARPDIGGRRRVRVFPLYGWWLERLRVTGFAGSGGPGIVSIGLSWPFDRKRFMDRRLAALAVRSAPGFSATEAMVDAFNARFGKVGGRLTLPLLRAEPWGVFQQSPWLLRYSLAHWRGATVLCAASENRFTNDSVEVFRSDGSTVDGLRDWRGRWPAFYAWAGGVVREAAADDPGDRRDRWGA